MCFTHSIRSSPIVTEFSGPMCCFLINSIASHFAEWEVKEFSRHHLFSSDKALFKEATVLSAVSPMQYTVVSYACIKTELEVSNSTWWVIMEHYSRQKVGLYFHFHRLDAAVAIYGVAMSSPGRETASSSFAMIARRQISDLTVAFWHLRATWQGWWQREQELFRGQPFPRWPDARRAREKVEWERNQDGRGEENLLPWKSPTARGCHCSRTREVWLFH